MSLGAMTVDNEIGRKGGPLSMARISFLGDDSYTTGGTVGFAALVAAALAMTGVTIEAVIQQNNSDHVCRYDKTNNKLIVQLMSTGAEVANAVDLSSITFALLVIGK